MKKILFILITCTLLHKTTIGSHAMGAEISYESLGSNQYLVNYIFYRDCTGINAPATIDLVAVSSLGTVSFILSPTPQSPLQIHTVCPTAQTTCNGGTYVGIEKWIYSDTITLTDAGMIMIYHSENARNTSLTTIVGAGSDNLFVYAMINNNQGYVNHSPVFNMNPEITICAGSHICIPSFVTDADGDSLVFELITPRTGPTPADTVDFQTGYSATQPFNSIPPVTFDSQTGEICLTPQLSSEVALRAMLVSEYRGGVLIGQVERDMQTFVQACTNNLPQCAGFNGAPTFNLNVCAGQQTCFFIPSLDLDMANTTFVNWDGSIPNVSITHTFGLRDTLFICWTPSDSDTINNPNCFYATVTDNACPFPGISYREFCINVTPSQICNPNAVSHLENHAEFSIYPQPANELLNFLFDQTHLGNTLTLYSLLGNEIISLPISEKDQRVNTAEFPAGIYTVKIADRYGKILQVKPVVVTK